VKNLKFLGMDGQILTAGKSGKIPPGQLNGGSTSTSESFQYYYHPDHLGSTSYMTDASGEVYQHLEYFAFGETFVEEHSNTDRTPYLYNGKELDEETGLYYYGARYYDARVSMWLGVDPKFFKYPGFSPYNYPDGREIWITYYQGGSEQHIKYSPGDKYEGKNKFLIKSYEALNYLNSSKTGNKLLSDLDKMDDKLHIKQGSKTEYDHEDKIAYFNPSQGLKLDDKEGKKRQTPALGLLHELAHGLKNLLNPEEYSIETQNYKDPQLYEQWSSPEEKRVIENIENPAARELNDIYNNNESERKTHKIGRIKL
jgi:RHS repeat-associated protein